MAEDPVHPDQAEPRDAGPPREKPPRRGRKVLIGVALVVVLIVVLLALGPTLISTGPGTRATLGLASNVSGYAINAEAISVNWGSGQSVTDLSVAAPEDRWSLSVASVNAPDLSLLPVMFGSRDVGLIKTGPIRFVQHATARTQPEEEPAEAPAFAPIPKGLKATVESERITYESPNAPPVVVRDFRFAGNLADPQNIKAAFSATLVQQQQSGRVEGNLTLTDAFNEAGEAQLARGAIEAQATIEQLPITAVDRLAQLNGRLSALIGPVLNAKLDVPQSPIRDLNATLTAQSKQIRNLKMQIARKGEQLVAGGSTASLQFDPGVLAALTGKAGAGSPRLQQPFVATLTIEQLAMPRPATGASFMAALKQAAANVRVTAQPIRMDVPGQGRMVLDGLQAGVETQSLAQQVAAGLEGQLRIAPPGGPARSGPINASAKVTRPLSTTPSGTLTAGRLPIALADALAGQQGRLVTTLGPTLDAQAKVQPVAAGDGEGDEGDASSGPGEGGQAAQAYRVDASFNTENLKAPLVGLYEPGSGVRMKTAPEPIRLNLPAAAQNVWLTRRRQTQAGGASAPPQGPSQARTPPLKAAGPLALTLEINPLKLAMTQGGGIDYAASGLVAEMRVQQARFRDPKTGRRYTLPGTVRVEGRNLKQGIKAVTDLILQEAEPAADGPAGPNEANENPPGELQPTNPSAGEQPDADQPGANRPADQSDNARSNNAAQPRADELPRGAIRSTTTIEGFVGEGGELNFAAAGINSHTRLNAVPSAFIDALAGQGGTLAAILGADTSLDADITKASSGGRAQVTLTTDNVEGRVPANLTAAQVLTLRADAPLRLRVTPEVADALLSRINPMLGSVVSADAPLKLTVQKQGFQVPLADLDWQKTNLRAHLDRAEVTLAAEGLAGQIVGMLTRANVLSEQNDYAATILPLDLRVNRGVVQYDQLGLALAGVSLRFAGKANLRTEQINMQLTLAGDRMPSEIRGLQVPLGGTFNQPKLDTDAFVQALGRQGIRSLIQRGMDEAAAGGQNNGGDERDVGSIFEDMLRGGGDRPRQNRRPNKNQSPRNSEGASQNDQPSQQNDRTPPRQQPRNPLEGLFDQLRKQDEDEQSQ